MGKGGRRLLAVHAGRCIYVNTRTRTLCPHPGVCLCSAAGRFRRGESANWPASLAGCGCSLVLSVSARRYTRDGLDCRARESGHDRPPHDPRRDISLPRGPGGQMHKGTPSAGDSSNCCEKTGGRGVDDGLRKGRASASAWACRDFMCERHLTL